MSPPVSLWLYLLGLVLLSNRSDGFLLTGSCSDIDGILCLDYSSQNLTLLRYMVGLKLTNYDGRKPVADLFLGQGSVANYTQIRELDLSGNGLTKEKVLSSISVSPSNTLKWLDLSYNMITELASPMLSGFPSLTCLFIDHNGLQTIQPGVFTTRHTQFQFLKINDNNLTGLPNDVFFNIRKTLKRLSMQNNHIHNHHQLQGYVVQGLRKLHEFKIDWSAMECLNAAKDVRKKIIARPRCLYIYNNKGRNQPSRLDYWWTKQKCRTLSFINNLILPDFTSLTRLAKFTKVKEVSFPHNNLQTIYPVQASATSRATKLLYSFNRISYIAPNTFVNNIKIEELYLDNNKLRTLHVNTFDKQIAMKKLYLNKNILLYLPGALFRYTTQLQELDVSDNPKLTYLPLSPAFFTEAPTATQTKFEFDGTAITTADTCALSYPGYVENKPQTLTNPLLPPFLQKSQTGAVSEVAYNSTLGNIAKESCRNAHGNLGCTFVNNNAKYACMDSDVVNDPVYYGGGIHCAPGFVLAMGFCRQIRHCEGSNNRFVVLPPAVSQLTRAQATAVCQDMGGFLPVWTLGTSLCLTAGLNKYEDPDFAAWFQKTVEISGPFENFNSDTGKSTYVFCALPPTDIGGKK